MQPKGLFERKIIPRATQITLHISRNKAEGVGPETWAGVHSHTATMSYSCPRPPPPARWKGSGDIGALSLSCALSCDHMCDNTNNYMTAIISLRNQ